MISTKSSQKHIKKVSSDSAELSFDLLSNLTYMAALAVADAPRDTIFAHAVRQPFQTSIFFKQVFLLVKRLGFEYVEAFRLVAKQARAETVKALLLRFASAIGSGEPEKEFLIQEARVEREKYSGDYIRKVESLQKWGDAYAAFLVSITLILVVALISTMIFEQGQMFVFILGGLMAPFSIIALFVIHSASPYEVVTFEGRRWPVLRRRARFFLLTLAPVGLALAVMVGVRMGMPMAFVVFGLSLLPSAYYAFRDDRLVRKADEEVAGFVRAMGNVSASLGSTVTKALEHLDKKSLGHLEPFIRRLHSRLRSKIEPAVCWERFREEVGSELLNRTTAMFFDGIKLGGAPDRVAEVANEYALNIAILRAKRHAIATQFAVLVVPLHAAMTGLVVFIYEIMKAFNARLQGALEEVLSQNPGAALRLPNLPIFHPRDLTSAGYVVSMALVVLTLANALAPKLAQGGHRLKITVFLSLMSIITGLNMQFIPPLAQSILAR